MHLRHFLLWLPMIVLAFVNATLRELVLIKQFSEVRAHQLSTVSLMILCAVYSWFIFPLLKIKTINQSLLIGFAWVLLTVAFEFTLGRLTNKSWSYLLRDYNLFAGRIWLLFLICLFLFPGLFFVVRNRH
jgi:hypothetical protein